ncbi:MAG: CaiB/BaiF CoA-transferase family protein [Actinomycetota bacterium]
MGVRVVEIGSIGPGPFTAMLLADLGADVIRIDRPGPVSPMNTGPINLLHRGRPSVAVDLKTAEGRELVLKLCESADALIEGFRPGVMERLGVGPEQVLERNPKLVFGRMTGYGQDGPMAMVAGHDINYISIAGVLGSVTREGERPLAPLNLVGDFGGGAMFLALGIVCALLEARTSGQGQVVDAAMVDGSAVLLSLFHGLRAGGLWSDSPGTNFLDSGAHFYEVYETADGGHVSVGALEPQFYAELLSIMEIDPADAPQWDQARWPDLKERFAAVFLTRTRDQWAALLEPAEACATAIYGLTEAADHPHMVARGTFVEIDGVRQPGPAPRFSRTPGAITGPPPPAGSDTDSGLAAWGIGDEERAALKAVGAIG